MEFIFGLKAEKVAGEKIRPFSGNDPTINRQSWSDPENRNLPRHKKIETLSCKTTSLCCTHVCSSYWGPFSRCLRKEMPCGLHFSYVCPEEEQSSPFTRQIELSMTILWKAVRLPRWLSCQWQFSGYAFPKSQAPSPCLWWRVSVLLFVCRSDSHGFTRLTWIKMNNAQLNEKV